MSELTSFSKDPQAVLDYVWDWTPWLDGDAISAHTVTTTIEDGGISIMSSTATGTTVTAWISGGTVGNTYKAVCSITTTGGRTDERTSFISVKDR